jgi:hypothetical protein
LTQLINILFRDNGNIGEKRLAARNTSITNFCNKTLFRDNGNIGEKRLTARNTLLPI